MNIITIRSLYKSYGSHRVLHNVDLQIASGKLVGFLGPNGAGKTTTIRILLGLLSASSGEAEIFGRSCRRQGKSIRQDIGYLPGDVYFYPNLTGRATLNFLARARREDCAAEINRLAEVFDLELDKRVRKYSTGMKQKLGLIQALMHRPSLLILDEPTSSLDPLIRNRVFDELRTVIAEKRSVLFSSHSLNEVESLCDEVIILREGKIVEQQQVEVLQSKALRRIEIVFAESQTIPSRQPEAFQLMKRVGQTLKGTWSADVESLLDWVRPLQIEDLIVERPDLNDLFMTYYSESVVESDDVEKNHD